MATIRPNPAPPEPGVPQAPTAQAPSPEVPDPQLSQARLSKDERRELLARIERQSSRTESPERILQRAEQAFESGNRTQAERLVLHLEQKEPSLLGLNHLRARLNAEKKREKSRANIRKAEDMLMRYVEERKKTAAEFALETLGELAPDHPRLAEYSIWVRDLDKEAAAMQELDNEMAAGRMALQVGDLNVAQRHLEQLEQLDPGSTWTHQLRSEISLAAAGQAESADIEEIKLRFEEHLVALRIPEAEKELEVLAKHEVPKITLDRLTVRLNEARSMRRDQQEMAAFEELFAQYLKSRRWQKSRDVAQQAGQRFPQHPRPAAMFNEVTMYEAEERQEQSVRQGIASLEQFIASGNRDSAQLALKLLKGKIEDARLARYEAKVASL